MGTGLGVESQGQRFWVQRFSAGVGCSQTNQKRNLLAPAGNFKSQIINTKKITRTQIQNSKPVWGIECYHFIMVIIITVNIVTTMIKLLQGNFTTGNRKSKQFMNGFAFQIATEQ
jgi:hypothetical protein